MKLLQKDLKEYRRLQWLKQDKICPICETEITEEDVVLDHDHSTGLCRNVLHRACNSSEGKIFNVYKRYISGKGISFENFIDNLMDYLKQDYSENPIHPTELTPNERELKFVNKRLKTLKRESVVLEYKERAKTLRKLIKEEREKNSWSKE